MSMSKFASKEDWALDQIKQKDKVISELVTELDDCSFMLWQILQYSPSANIDTKKIHDAFKKRKKSIDPLIEKYGKDQ